MKFSCTLFAEYVLKITRGGVRTRLPTVLCGFKMAQTVSKIFKLF